MTKKQLLKKLIYQGMLASRRLRQAFERIDRADFVLPKYLDLAYEDYPLPIGYDQTISQPYTVAFMLRLLDVKRGENILEIGAGSGWQTALLGYLVGRKGRVAALERIPELVELAKFNLAKYPVCYRTRRRQGFGGQASTIQIFNADGSLGYVKEAPYDRIIAAASARVIPEQWKDQLKIGGKIVAPVKDSIVVIDKISRDEYQQTEHWGFAFVPLVEG